MPRLSPSLSSLAPRSARQWPRSSLSGHDKARRRRALASGAFRAALVTRRPLIHSLAGLPENLPDQRVQPLHRISLCVRPENRTRRIRNGGLSPRSHGQIVRAYQRD